MNEERREDFDWVTARAKCFAAEVFEKLRLQVKADLEVRNALLVDKREHFAVVDNGNTFSVIVPANPLQNHRVSFTLANDKISFQKGSSKLKCEATLTLNDDGDCKLKVNKRECELWQFRRLALEDLLFID